MSHIKNKFMPKLPPKPFTPVELRANDEGFARFDVVGRTYTMDKTAFFSSVVSKGEELLAGPIRIVSSENGAESVWSEADVLPLDENKPTNATVVAAMTSENFYVNTAITVEYDGMAKVDIKLMPRGKTVKEEYFGITRWPSYNLDYLWLEIPIKKEYALFKQQTITSSAILPDGRTEPKSFFGYGGVMEKGTTKYPFIPQYILHNGDVGFGFFTESEENWQIADPDNAVEVIIDDEQAVIRLHLLDSHPISWEHKENAAIEMGAFGPISWTFGFMALPFKPYPANPYREKAVHIDCFKRFPEDHDEYLKRNFIKDDGTVLDESGFDRLVRLGVNTLYLHEKWNTFQNGTGLSKRAADRLRFIVDECHKRGIKVKPYFGYELASIVPNFAEKIREYACLDKPDANIGSGWNRTPFQRDNRVCYASDYRYELAQGIDHLLDTIPFDGFYLDGTNYPAACGNANHGCGYKDVEGNWKPEYDFWGIREVMKLLYDVAERHGAEIDTHNSSGCALSALAFCHSIWDGEAVQGLLMQGTVSDMPKGVFEGVYNGRLFGIPIAMLCYENKEKGWHIEKSNAMSFLSGTIPKPNDMDVPLEKTSEIWAILDKFPIEKSTWHPYWKEGGVAISSNEKVKASYYEYENNLGKKELLVFVGNTSKNEAVDWTLTVEGGTIHQIRPAVEGSFNGVTDKETLEGFQNKIFLVEC